MPACMRFVCIHFSCSQLDSQGSSLATRILRVEWKGNENQVVVESVRVKQAPPKTLILCLSSVKSTLDLPLFGSQK